MKRRNGEGKEQAQPTFNGQRTTDNSMISPELEKRMREAGPRKGRGPMLLCALLIAVGVASFLVGVLGSRPERAWQAYLINFVFWSGIAFGAIMFSAVLTIVDARWGRPLKRLAEGFVAFTPVACALFWVLYFGKDYLFPWVHDPPPAKAAWLNAGFLFLRDGIGLILLTAVGLAIVYRSSRMDRGTNSMGDSDRTQGVENSVRTQKVLAPIYGVLYAFVLSLLAFDLIMSLDPHWFSTLFGVWYFIGSFYAALAAIVIMAILGVRTMGMGPFVKPLQFLSLGQLLLGFCLITGDFFFTQVLIMWYGNLPEETHYVITRMRGEPWYALSWIIPLFCYVIPFGVLISRKIKMRAVPMAVLSVMVLTGIWLERWILVAPSVWKEKSLPLGIPELLITAGFAGLVFLCVHWFLSRFPVLPWGDPLFLEAVSTSENRQQR